MTSLRGYIDESGDRKDLFSLSVILATDATWFTIEREWLKVIDAKNKQLLSEGRKPISRYHAADCGSCQDDFAGWSVNEQIEFSKQLLPIISKTERSDAYGYTLSLNQLVREIPETAPNPEAFAHVILLHMLMHTIGKATLSRYPDAIIGLVHDHGDYDQVFLMSFNQMIQDVNFEYRNRFTNISPMRWQKCIPLQPADLIAYEHFKESERHMHQLARDRRKSLTAILDDEPILLGGSLGGFNSEVFQTLKRSIDALDDDSKKILFATARIAL
jgi:hypothetical protein